MRMYIYIYIGTISNDSQLTPIRVPNLRVWLG